MTLYKSIRSGLGVLLYQVRKWLQILREEPAQNDFKLTVLATAACLASGIRKEVGPKILVGTHHKVLTKYMIRIFEVFAHMTNRSISVGMAADADYDADIIFDHHSQFDFSRVNPNHVGIHFRRDPRDLVISAGFYHKRSDEEQLHVPLAHLDGKTYQEHVNEMDSMEDVFLFELEQSAGWNIDHMLQWDYSRGFIELKYEDLVTLEGGVEFRKALKNWPFSNVEKSLLGELFDYYSVYGKGGKKNRHVRNPISKQFADHFSVKLYAAFNKRFPDALEKLGYK